MAQQPGFGAPQFMQPMMTGAPQMQSPFSDPRPQQFAPLQTQPTGFNAVPQFPQQTGVNSFLPAPLEPQRTSMPPLQQPQQTGFGGVGQSFSPNPSLNSTNSLPPPVTPLQPQKTGPAPPVRFGVSDKIAPQPTGRRANLSQASEYPPSVCPNSNFHRTSAFVPDSNYSSQLHKTPLASKLMTGAGLALGVCVETLHALFGKPGRFLDSAEIGRSDILAVRAIQTRSFTVAVHPTITSFLSVVASTDGLRRHHDKTCHQSESWVWLPVMWWQSVLEKESVGQLFVQNSALQRCTSAFDLGREAGTGNEGRDRDEESGRRCYYWTEAEGLIRSGWL